MLILSTKPNSYTLLNVIDKSFNTNNLTSNKIIDVLHVLSQQKLTLSADWHFHLAILLAKAGWVQKAETEMHIAYSQDSNLMDGYAHIGWHAYLDNKKYNKILALFHKDKELGKLSPKWQIKEAMVTAQEYSMEKASSLIDEAYMKSPKLKNGYAQVAWTAYSKDLAFDKMLPYFSIDFHKKKLSSKWLLGYAQSLAATGQFDAAKSMVLKAYDMDESLVNGFAQCGRNRFLFIEYNPAKALTWFTEDFKLGRLSGQLYIWYGVIFAALGQLHNALKIIDTCYSNNPKVKDGFVLAGWYYYVLYQHAPQKAIKLIERDKYLARNTSKANNILAGLYTYLDAREYALELVEDSYKQNDIIMGGYASIGFSDYAKHQDLQHLKMDMDKDFALGRLEQHSLLYLYACLFQRLKDQNNTNYFFQKATNKTTFAKNYAQTFLRTTCLTLNKQKWDFFNWIIDNSKF